MNTGRPTRHYPEQISRRLRQYHIIQWGDLYHTSRHNDSTILGNLLWYFYYFFWWGHPNFGSSRVLPDVDPKPISSGERFSSTTRWPSYWKRPLFSTSGFWWLQQPRGSEGSSRGHGGKMASGPGGHSCSNIHTTTRGEALNGVFTSSLPHTIYIYTYATVYEWVLLMHWLLFNIDTLLFNTQAIPSDIIYNIWNDIKTVILYTTYIQYTVVTVYNMMVWGSSHIKKKSFGRRLSTIHLIEASDPA